MLFQTFFSSGEMYARICLQLFLNLRTIAGKGIQANTNIHFDPFTLFNTQHKLSVFGLSYFFFSFSFDCVDWLFVIGKIGQAVKD